MSEAKTNGIATAEDFRKAALKAREDRAQLVTLPSGLVARLVKLTPEEHFYLLVSLPQSVAAAVETGIGPGLAPGIIVPAAAEAPIVAPTAEQVRETVALAKRTAALVRFVFVSPRVPDEVKPVTGISVADITFALRWARGEVAADGQSLAEFRPGAQGPVPAPGTDGGDVPSAPQ